MTRSRFTSLTRSVCTAAVAVALSAAGAQLASAAAPSPTAGHSAVTSTASPKATTTSVPGPSGPFLGTLGTRPDTAGAEAAAGITLGMVEIQWRDYEPQPGVFSTVYQNIIAARIAAMQAAGMRITLGLGLQYAPAWLLVMPDSHLVDNHGTVSTAANLIFNVQLRDQADAYLAHLNSVFNLNSFWAIRVTSGTASEAVYPLTNTYWAFDASAQNGPNMPASMARNPLPGWKPGTGDATVAQMTGWAAWYVSALDDAVNWQIQQVKQAGFTGYIQVVTPGFGLTPNKETNAIAGGLADGTLGTGAVWAQFYTGLPDKTHVVAYVSSVGDGSGGNDSCTPTDDTVALTSPLVAWWSSTRWISRVAHANGLPVAGEAPGYNPTSPTAAAHYTDTSTVGLMATAVRQATTCGFQGLYWAHDDQFYSTTQVLPITALSAYSTTGTTVPAAAPGAN